MASPTSLSFFKFRKHSHQISAALVATVVCWQIGKPLHSATVYWDMNGTTAGASSNGLATGTWDASNTFFNTDSTGTNGGSIAAWANGDSLVFGAGTNATQAYTVTVSGTQGIGGLTFEEGLVTLTGGTLQMTANSDFNVASGLTSTINSTIDGAFNLSKLGAGTLVLGGANTYSGRTLINAGTLSISADNNLGAVPGAVTADSINFTGSSTLQFTGTGNPTINSNRGITIGNTFTGTAQVIDSGNTVNYGGVVTGIAGTTFRKTGAGTLELTGNSTASFLGALNVDGGTLRISGNGEMAGTSGVTISNRGALTLDNAVTNLGNRTAGAITSTGGTINFIGNAATTTETLGALTLNAGALTINSTAGAGGSTLTIPSIATRAAGGTLYLNNNAGATVVLGTAPALVNSVLRYAVVNNGSLISFANYPTSAGTNQTVVPLALASHNQGAETTWVAANNVRPTADVTVTAGRSLYTLTLDSGIDLLAPAGDRTLTITGGVLQTGGTSIIGATATAEHILAWGANEAIFHTIGDLTIQRGDTNVLTGSGGMTKTGAGVLQVHFANAITGVLNINEGTYRAIGAGSGTTPVANTALGNGSVAMNGGNIDLRADVQNNFGRNVTVNADGTISTGRNTAGTAAVHQLATLTMAPNRTLTLSSGALNTIDTAYGLTFTTTTLQGPATFNVNNNGTGLGTLTVGTLSGAFPITKTGAGELLTSGLTGYTSSVDIQAGAVGWSFNNSGNTLTEAQIFSGPGAVINRANGTVNITGANTFTGGITNTTGTLQFSTVSNNGGSASNLGQGTDGITLSGGTLAFIGNTNQSTNRAINMTVASTLAANGTGGATITYAGSINANAINPTFTGTGAGFLTGGLTQTGIAADATMSSGNWTFSGATTTIADDFTVTGASTVLNLNSTNALAFAASVDATLQIQAGAVVNLGADNAVTAAGFDRLLIGQGGAAATNTLNMSTFDLTTDRLDLGVATTGLFGVITGTASSDLTVTTTLNLFRGSIGASLISPVAVIKQGLGDLTLSGSANNLSNTTAARVDAGNLILDFSTFNTSKLTATTGLDMRGGTLTITGNAAATAQTVASLTLANGGANKIDINAGAGGAILNLNAFTRAALANDGTMRFELPTGTQSATNGITTDSLNTIGTGSNAILGGWATVDTGSGVFFARNTPNTVDGNIGAATTTITPTLNSWTAGINVSDDNAGPTGFSGTLTDFLIINSLRFDANAASAVTLPAGGILSIASGGILMTSNAATGAHSISGGTLNSGIGELIFIQDSVAQGLTVSSTITGATGVTKTGNGILTLSGDNNYSGITDIQAGTLITNGNGIGNASAVTLADDQASTLQLTGNETIGSLAGGNAGGGITVGTVALGSNTLTINQTAATATYAGVFTGSGAIVRNGTSGIGNTLFTGTSGSGFTGTVTVNGGLLYLEGAATMDASAFTVNKGASFLISNTGATRSGTRILDTTPITLNSADGAWNTETRPSGLAIRTDQNATTNETIGNLVFNSGASYLRGEASGTTGVAQLIANDFVRNNNATVNARGRAMGGTAGDRNQFRIGTAGNQTAFIGTVDNANLVGGGGAAGAKNIDIVPWGIGETLTTTLADTNMGNSLITYVSGNGFRALDFATEYNTFATKTANTDNIRESLTANLTGLAANTLNALVLHNNSTAASTINVTGTGAGQALQVTSGALLFTLNTAATPSSAHSIVLGGFDNGITMGGAGITNEYIIHVVNPSSAATTPTLTATISSPLTSAADITKSGRGTLILSGNNTAGGNTRKTTLNEGTLQIGDLDNIGGSTGGLVFAGGTLQLGSAFDTATDDLSTRTITFLNGGGTLDTNGKSPTFASSLGSGSGTFTKVGAGNLTLNATTTLTGATAVTAGTVTLGANQAIGTGALTVSGATTVLAMGSNNATVAGLTLTSAGVSVTGSGTLTVNGDTIINNTSSIAPILGGTMNLLNPGGGVLTLSNAANTFTGYTWVQSGSISVANLANAGVNSGLGAPAAGENAAIRLGSTTTAGTLAITSTTGTGGTTDRPFWLTGTTGGGTIDNDGTAALTLNGNILSRENGAKTLTLQGAATGFNNTLNGIIDQWLGTISLTKAEAGTWVLANTTSPSTYTGVNTITLGTLQVNRATGGLGDSTAVNAINLNGGTLSFRNEGAGNNGTVIYGSASNPSGYNVQLSATSTINVANLTANTGNTIQLGPLTQAAAAARTLNVTGANGYTLTLPSLGLSPGTGNTTTINPTTSSIIVTGNVINPMTGFSTGNFDTIVLDGTSTGNIIGGTIADAVGGGFTPVLLGGYTIVTKSNTSTWTLNGSGSTYTGNTNINGGVLIAGTDTSLGNSLISFGGGTLNNQDENRTFANNLQMAGAGTLTGTGNFAFNGNVNQTGGSQMLNINNTGTTTIGDASTDTLTLAENNQTRTLTLNVANTASAIVNATIQDGTGTGADGFTKTGLGSLSINAANFYTGATTLDNGTTAFTVAQSLTASTNSLILGSAAATTTPVTVDFDNVNATFGGALTMNINSATASTINIDPTRTLTINGNVQIGATAGVANSVTNLSLNGGGAFSVITAAAGTFTVGGNTSGNAQDTTLDLTGLASTTINTSTTGTFRVNPAGSANIAGSKSTLLLPTPGVADTVATATITAGTIAIGNGVTFNSQAGQINTITLGTGLTTLNANTINVGTGSRDIGQIIFAGANGDLKIRAADGTGRATLIAVGAGGGSTGTTETTTNNLVDFSGHDSDILVSTLNVGNQPRTGNLTSEFRFGAGDGSLASVLDVTNVNIGFRTGTAATTSILTNRVNLSGGTVTFGNVGGTGTGVDIGNSTYNQSGAASTIGELNISGSTVMIHNSTTLGAAVRLGTNVAAGGGTVTASMNLTGGTTTLGGHIVRDATSPRTTSNLLLNGASAILNMSGNNIGTATENITFDLRQGTLNNLGQFNGGANLVKTTSGTLTVGGTNSYTGNNVFQEGTVIADGGANNLLSQTALTLGNATTSAVLQLGNANGASNQTFTSLTTSGTGTANAIIGGNAAFSTLTINQSTNTQFEGNIGGTGANQNNLNVIKSGVGELTISGAAAAGAAWTGTTAVNGGKLFIDHKDAFAATSTSLTVADGTEFALRGAGLTANQVYGFGASVGNKITLGTGTGTAILGFRLDGAFNTQLRLLTGQSMTVAAGTTFQTAVYVGSAPTAGQGYVLIDGADANSLHAGGGTFDINPVVFNGGSFTYALTNVTLGGTVDRWVITPTAQAAAAEVWWKGDLTGIGTGVWSASTTSGTGFPTNWDDSQSGGNDALVPPDSGSIVRFSATGATNFATTLGANMTIQELIFHSGGTAISVDGNSGLYTLTLGNTVDISGITLQTGAPNVSISADVALAQAQSFNIADVASTLTFSRGLSGTGSLGINSNGSSTGTMILSGVNGLATYTGATNLVAGRLILEGGANNRLPTTTALTMGNATLGTTLQLGDAVNGASNTTIGTLNTGAATTNAIVGGGAANSTLTVVQGAAGSFNGVIGGGGTNENNLALTKQGSAMLTLNGANTYLGLTTVNNGILALGSTATLTQSSGITVSAIAGVTATFDNNSRTTMLTGGITLGGANTGATPQIINTGSSGSITLGGSVLFDGTNNPLGGSIAAPLDLGTAARTFTANDSTTATTDLTISGAVTTANPGATGLTLTLDGTGTGSLTGSVTLANGSTDGSTADVIKAGTGTWNLGGTLTLGDDFVINAGILNVNTGASIVFNATPGSTTPDFFTDVGASSIANFNAVNSIVGNSATNRLFSRDGSTINLNISGAIGSSIEQVVLGGEDNQGVGNMVLAGGTTNTLNSGTLILGFNSAGENGNLTGTGTLAGVTTITLRNGTVSANVTGTGNTTKDENLTVTVSGNNTLTGTTLNREGTLNLDFTTNAGTDNKIGTGAFTVGSGTNNDNRAITNLIGNATAASTQTVASLAVNGGPSEINLSSAGGQNMTFAVTGALTRSAGTVNVSLPNANTIFSYSGGTNNTNGIVGGWMTLNNTDFATISVGQIVAATYTTQNNAALWGTNQNITNSAAFTGTVDAACNTINSLRFNAAATSTISIGTGNSLILTSGGILETAAVGANASTITGGNLISSINEFIVTQNNASSTLTIASRLLSGSTTSPNITKNGAGVLVLSGTNNQTGIIFIDEGTLRLSGGSAVSDTSTINFRNVTGATLELAASQTETVGSLAGDTGGNIILNTGSTLTVNQSAANSVSAVITGAGTFVKSGGSTLTLTSTSTMTGTVRVDQGQLLLSGNVANLGTATAIILNGPTSSIQNNQDQAAANNRVAGTVTLNNTAGGTGFAISKSGSTGNATDAVGALTLGAGHNVISATSAVAATVGQWTFASLAATNPNRATALMRGLDLGSDVATQRGQIVITAALSGSYAPVGTTAGGVIGTTKNLQIVPYMIGDVTAAGLGNSFVTSTTANGLRPLVAAEYEANSTTPTAGNNVRFTATTAISTLATINSLVLDAGTGINLTAGTPGAMEVTSGAILAAGAANHSIGSSINALTTGGGRDYTVYVTAAAQSLAMDAALTSAVPLVKSGAGTLSLTNTGNLFTDVYLNQGNISIDNLNKVNGTTNTLHFFGGGVQLAAGFTGDLSNKPWNINTGGGTIDVSLVTAGTSFANGIDDTTASASDTLNIFTRATGATGVIGQLTIQGASSFTGTTVIRNSGIDSGLINGVILNGTTNAAINGNLVIGNEVNINNNFDAVVALGASDQIVDTASITFRGVSGEFAYFKLLGFNETVAGISDTTATGVVENRETDTVSASGTLTLNSSADFSYNGFFRDVSTGLADTNKLILVKQGTGTQTLSGVQIRHSGTTTISAGGLTLTDVTNWQSAITNNATLTLNQTGATTRTHSNTISGSGTIVKLGTGTVTLSGANTSYSGITDIQQGVLSFSASNNLGDGSATNNIRIANNAILQSTGANVDLGANRSISMGGLGATIDVTTGNVLTVSGLIQGDECHTLTKSGAGTLVVTGINTYTSPTNVTAGGLQVGSSGTGQTGSGDLTVSSTSTVFGTGTIRSLNVTFATGSTLHAGDGTGTSSLGTLTFTPTAGGGTHNIQGSVIFGVSTPTMTDPTFGGFEIGSAGYNSWVDGVTGTGNHDRLRFTNSDGGSSYSLNFLTNSGSLQVLSSGFTPTIGQVFNLMDWGNLVSANFTGFNIGSSIRTGNNLDANEGAFDLPDISSFGYAWDVSRFTASGNIAVVPEPGRFLLLCFGLSLSLFRRRRSSII
jgi:autotransporter-associated beta strand protein